MESPDRAHLVVKNTFIDAVEEEDDDGGPGRTVSDQTGLHPKRVIQLGRLTGRPQPINEERASVTTEQQLGDDDDDDEDDDDEMPLTRTHSVAYPAYHGSFVPGAGLGDEGVGGLEDASGCGAGHADAYGMMAGAGNMPWGYPSPYMFDGYNMYPPCFGGMPLGGMMPTPGAAGSDCTGLGAPRGDGKGGKQGGEGHEGHEGLEASAPSDWPGHAGGGLADPPALGTGPPLGMLHAFHPETREMGIVAPDFRTFSKVGYEGRLSVVSEKEVHTDGVQRYLVQFSAGELSRADGVGFVFSPRLPCAKNIQRIVSIFVNQRGRICMRVFADIVRASAYVKPLELGDWVEMAIDLDERVATFNIWPRTANGWPSLMGRPASTAVFPYGQRLARLNQANHKSVNLSVGHLACVVKNIGVTVTVAS
uniref:Uncharacterized protein n=1 Tax=Zooxanthella nutricula TaxID=1333877 RepID=A0A7S2VH73_9DINO